MERMTYTPMGRKWTAMGSGSGSPSAGPTLATNRYRYNGKEEQTLAAGVPYTDYGARFFDPDHCTWLSPDPLSGKYPGVYPYAFCAGDPVNYVDLDGRDAYVFDSNGYFVQKIEQKGKHYISVREYDEQGNYIEQRIRFADPKNDPADIDNGKITQLIFVSEEEIHSIMERQGGFDNLSLKEFIDASNSTGTGESHNFDYTSSELSSLYNGELDGNEIKSEFLFIPDGTKMAHNIMNFGNFIWAASGYISIHSLGALKLGAHGNSLGLFNKNTWKNRMYNNRSYNNYKPQLDSSDDQRSISQGYRFAKNNNYGH